MDVCEQDLQNAANFPLAGWAPYNELYGCDPPNSKLSEHSTVALLMNGDPQTVFYRRQDEDPLSIALRESKAQKVQPSEWAAMDASGKLVSTMEGRPHTICRAPLRERRDRPIANGPWALRLGPDASGALGQYIASPQKMAPGTRKATVREVLQVLENPNQLGNSSTAHSDGCLGFSVYAYRSSEVLFGDVKVRDDVLVRLEGLRCKGHNDKSSVCQKTKAGYCPCCTIPTHVAIPNSFVLGAGGVRKQQTIGPWAAFGPWGPRRFVAIKYVYESSNREPLPPGWD